MTTAAILPFIHAQGSWGEIGRQVGQMFKPAIERHLEAWTRHVVAETGCPRSAVEAAAAPYARPIRDHTPFLWEELDGMSRGSGIPISRLLILQARAEVMRANKRPLEYLNSEQPLVNLLQELSKRTNNRQIFVQTPTFSVTLEKRA